MTPGERPDNTRRAFSLTELVVVLVVLGGLAVWLGPKAIGQVDGRQEQVLRENLQYLRGQIMIYRAQHGGTPPGFPDGDRTHKPDDVTVLLQLTRYTNAAGQTSPTPSDEFRYGPYLRAIPANPLAGNSDLQLTAPGEGLPEQPDGSEGWLYDPYTGRLLANSPGRDLTGRAYLDY